MTEQHPPEPEATPETTAPVEPTAGEPTEATATHETTVSEPVAAERRGGAPTWVKIVIPVVLIALLAGGGFAAYELLGHKSHDITTPATAGKMKRDSAAEKKYASQIKVAQQRFGQQAGATDYVKAAIYDQTDSKRGPTGPLLFIGAKLSDKAAKKQDPAAWIKKNFTTPATTNGFKVTTIKLDGDAKGACAASAQRQGAVCVWATNDTIGELFPSTTGYDASSLGAIMRSLRADVESA